MTFWANSTTALTDDWELKFRFDVKLANAFRVDSYDLTARVLTLNLTHKFLPTADLRGTSTHHYFKDGVRSILHTVYFPGIMANRGKASLFVFLTKTLKLSTVT